MLLQLVQAQIEVCGQSVSHSGSQYRPACTHVSSGAVSSPDLSSFSRGVEALEAAGEDDILGQLEVNEGQCYFCRKV